MNDEIVQEVAIMLSVLSNNGRGGGGLARNSESSFYSTFCFPVTVFSKQEQGIIPPGSHDEDGLSAIVQIHRLLQVLLFVFPRELRNTLKVHSTYWISQLVPRVKCFLGKGEA